MESSIRELDGALHRVLIEPLRHLMFNPPLEFGNVHGLLILRTTSLVADQLGWRITDYVVEHAHGDNLIDQVYR